jgi:Fe-S-cluster-containing hydrogenase component 2/CRP-like cAMP-binding protein
MTQLADDFGLYIGSRDEDEGLFSRDIAGQLVRLDAPTVSDYEKQVSVQIDGQSVTVPLAEPLKDSQGNLVLDIDGRTTPRYTTIYDAATKLYGEKQGDVAKIPIPVLCHQPHMQPVAVCRMCVVQIYGQKRGKRSPERKLLPACQHQVKDGMEVFTMNADGPDGERVRKAVNVMTELLSADHLKDAPSPAPAAELAPFNELKQISDRCGLKESRFSLDVLQTPPVKPSPTGRRGLDGTSPVFMVDHSACILCERCMRACDEVKKNNVIGRTGKGSTAGISFDLNDPMGESSCVQCGECMVSCPTSAITFKPVAKVKVKSGQRDAKPIPAAELIQDPLFAEVPPKFLLWQEGLVTRSNVRAGDLLCKQGDPGNTAFVVKEGEVEIIAAGEKGKTPKPFKLKHSRTDPEPLILGEMACLSGSPRTADVRAAGNGEIWEVRRNVLDRIMRSPRQRTRFEKMYRERALDVVLRNGELFEGLPEEEYKKCVDFLRPNLSFVRVNPGQQMFRQGDWADAMYLVRLGHVNIAISRFGSEATYIQRGPGAVIGEIGLLAIEPEDMPKGADAIDRLMASAFESSPDDLGMAIPSGQRTATCSALDHLELARVDRAAFLKMVRDFPAVRRRLIDLSIRRLRGDTTPGDGSAAIRRDFIEQGLYQGQSLLVMDLKKCTHCDECVRACVQQHGNESHGVPVTRLIRDGLRFANYLVAASCRSCKDAYCMIGCPVDAIHRGKHQQIVIEDHCIGCGLCATNCPFGNINMPENELRQLEVPDPNQPARTIRIAQRKASTCDLCDAEGHRDTPLPRCVHACPHDAAHRMTGEELLTEVTSNIRI